MKHRTARTLIVALILALGLIACGEDVAPGDASVGSPDATVPSDAASLDAVGGDATQVDMGGPDAGTQAGPDSGRTDAAPRDANQRDFDFGATITATVGEWTWVDVPDSRCMNDTPTGFGVNTSSTSDKVIIFLMGGNACFNVGSCLITANTDGYGEVKFARDAPGLTNGAFDRVSQDNYFRDWNYVFVPYCSGDVFAGANPNAMINTTSFNFQGYENITLFLERVVPTFSGASEVMLTGVSAGGFGAFMNYDQVARAFGPSTNVTLVNDSGAAMAAAFMSGCLQTHFAEFWQLERTIPSDCTDCFTSLDGDFVEDYMRYLITKHADRNFALISSEQDQTIRTFWGFGLNECRDLLPGFVAPMYPGALFTEGLLDVRDRIFAGSDNAKLFMPPGDRHVFLDSPPWETMLDGVVLQDWMIGAIEDHVDWENVPLP